MTNKINIQKFDKNDIKWTITISSLAFFISLFLMLLSESMLGQHNIILSIILLLVFMSLNVIADMIGLAISSCQVEKIIGMTKNSKVIRMAEKLINNADKTSSILSDVIGDICGILCGVSGATFSIFLSNITSLGYLKIIIATLINAIIASITVLLKSISKNYAINHSQNLVYKISYLLSKIKNKKEK